MKSRVGTVVALAVVAAAVSHRSAWVTWADHLGQVQPSAPARPIPVRPILERQDPNDVPSCAARHPAIQQFTLYAPAHLTRWAPLGVLSWDPRRWWAC